MTLPIDSLSIPTPLLCSYHLHPSNLCLLLYHLSSHDRNGLCDGWYSGLPSPFPQTEGAGRRYAVNAMSKFLGRDIPMESIFAPDEAY
jgi:hypothetical protein